MLNRILAVFLCLMLVAMLVLGSAAAAVLRDTGEAYSRERLSSAAELVLQDLDAGASPAKAALTASKVFSSTDHMVRLTLVARDGVVLAESGASTADLDNHMFRPEIAGAFTTGGTATDIRFSSTLQMDMLYFARYDETRDLVIRSAMPLSELRSASAALTLRIVWLTSILLLLALLAGILSIRAASRRLDEMKRVAVAITSGRYDLRVHHLLGDRSGIGRLADAFNEMATRLESSVEGLADGAYRMDAILDALDTPLFAVDPSMAVTFLNTEARRRFGIEAGHEEAGKPMLFFVRSQEVETFVKQSMKAARRGTMEWRQETDDGIRVWRISASPMVKSGGGAITVFHDITENTRLHRMRSDFVANVTHELSTPLTAIRGFTETLRGGAIRNEALASRFLEIIDLEAERLHRLIEDILTLSEIEGGRSEAEPVLFDLNERIDRTVVLLEEAAAKRHVQLIAGPPTLPEAESADEEPADPEPFSIQADPDRIGQLLVNLMDNAIKYNRAGGKVWVWAERERAGRVALHVKDDGIGIEEDQKARIFERFYRVDKGRSRESGGTGLGLSIVKHIAAIYGGSIRVESTPGEGSEFTVTLDV